MSQIFKYVINLKDRSDRRVEMEEQLRRVEWNAEFSNSNREDGPAAFPSAGSRGCFLSHLCTLKRGQIMKGHIIIMEDDLDFVPGFPGLWKEAYDQLKRTDWSIFYPGHVLSDEPDGLSLIAPTKSVLCAHF